MLTLGTRGDVEIFVLLARALIARGHQVVIGTSPFFRPRLDEAGVGSVPVGSGTQDELVRILRSLAAVTDRRERVRRYSRQWLRPQFAAGLPAIKAAVATADYFVNNLKFVLRRHDAIVPGASVTYDPPGKVEDLGRYATQWPESREVILELVGMSKVLVDPEDRWGPQYHFTGFWTDDAAPAWTPPPDLESFVASGPPPVVVTMGSMVMFDAERFGRTVVEALRRSEQRGVVVGSWSGIGHVEAPADQIRCVAEVPYSWLFPRAACVVHHGGCGTVALTVRAGRPSILLPQITSQEHFARLLDRAGLAAGVFDPDALSPDALARAIREVVGDERWAAAARRWQTTLAAEGGVTAAADLIESHWSALRRRTAS